MFERRVFIKKEWIPQTRSSGEYQYFVEVERKLKSGSICLDTEYISCNYDTASQYGYRLSQHYGCTFGGLQ